MHTLAINGYRGISAENIPLNKVNIIIGENGSGKTSFLEAVFLVTLLNSAYPLDERMNWLTHTFFSRGDVLSSILTLEDSTIKLDDNKVEIKKEGIDTIRLVSDYTSVKISLKRSMVVPENALPVIAYSPSYEVEKSNVGVFTPVYITSYFDAFDNPERIISKAKRKGFESNDLEILRDEVTGYYKLFKGYLPVYVLGRGMLKRELIKASLKFCDVLLVDEVEDSLHPDMLLNVIKETKESNATLFITTHSNEVLKMAYNVYEKEKLNIIVMKDRRVIAYNNPKDVEAIMSLEPSLSWIKYV
ncbi:AAA family ATPase [Acidianus sp. HS-5]|uniref:AAA family ATPase n=1 Tax=Acidianus sp. HS-5 TaxID=2886040 RepID=UPI001F46624E|nr:AAA family ATPase [Acidianus sp. HS-5]BDC17416.1 hypothetical protein HS5_03060 [Acidianus sp. HS-5]